MTEKATITSVIKYYELRMEDGRFWRFEHLADLQRFAGKNGIDIKISKKRGPTVRPKNKYR